MPFNPVPLLYIDPPWNYEVWGKKGKGRSAENHYPTMKIKDICALPVPDLLAKNAAVCMWTTAPNKDDADKVADAWGLKYKTALFTWVKLNKRYRENFVKMFTDTGDLDLCLDWLIDHAFKIGNGHYTRANAEQCWLLTKGKPLKRLDLGVPSLIVTAIDKHSAKPEIAAERIVRLFGDLPRIEVFARRYRPGWQSIGFDLDGLDARNSIPLLLENGTFAQYTARGLALPSNDQIDRVLTTLNTPIHHWDEPDKQLSLVA